MRSHKSSVRIGASRTRTVTVPARTIHFSPQRLQISKSLRSFSTSQSRPLRNFLELKNLSSDEIKERLEQNYKILQGLYEEIQKKQDQVQEEVKPVEEEKLS